MSAGSLLPQPLRSFQSARRGIDLRTIIRMRLVATVALAAVLAGLALHAARPTPAHAEARGALVIAGNGPELPMVEALVHQFEKSQSGIFVDVLWDTAAKPTKQVRSGEAQIAVTGAPEADLRATQIAWDGIGVVVHLSNNAKDLTAQQIGEIFAGKYAVWSEVGGPDTTIHVIDRPPQENVRHAFETQLNIADKMTSKAQVIAKDEKVIKAVVGTLPPKSAVAFLSLEHALSAVHSGVAIRLLTVDKVEPEEPTVKDGRYKLRRPVLLVSKTDPSPVVAAFEAFCASPAGQKIIDDFYTPLAP